MKRILIAAALITQSAFALTSSVRPVKGDFMEAQASFRNFIPNPSAIRNTLNWTASSVTVARDTDAADAYEGIASFALTSATNPATFCTSDIALPEPYDDGINGEINVYFKGDASKWQLEVRSSGGSTVLADVDLTNETSWRKATLNYPMADNYRICVSSNAASPANINVAGFYWGPATNLSQVAQAQAIVSAKRATSDQTISTTADTTVVFNSESLDVFGEYDTSTGTFTAKSTAELLFHAGFAQTSFTSTEYGYAKVFKGATEQCRTLNNVTSTTNYQYIPGCRVSVVAGDTVTVKSASIADASYGISYGGGASVTDSWLSIYRFPSSSEIAVRADQSGLTNWASYTATLTNLGNATQALEWRRVGDSIQIKGRVTIGSSLPTGTLTISAPSGVTFSDSANIASGFATASKTTFPLGGGQIISSTTFGFLAQAANAAWNATNPFTWANGDYLDINFEAKVVGWSYTQPAPLLVGSVTSSSSGLRRIEDARVNCQAASAITSQSSSWVSSIGNISAGACAVTLATGIFSATPTCVQGAETDNGGTPVLIRITPASATSLTIDCANDAGTACTNWNLGLICMGPR